jgi:hypothetical protein
MVIAMAAMRMMQVTTNKIIQVVSVRYPFMSARGTVGMLLIMRLAVVIGRASIRISVPD